MEGATTGIKHVESESIVDSPFKETSKREGINNKDVRSSLEEHKAIQKRKTRKFRKQEEKKKKIPKHQGTSTFYAVIGVQSNLMIYKPVNHLPSV